MGSDLGEQLEKRIDEFIAAADKAYGLDTARLTSEAPNWLAGLPPQYAEELSALSLGSRCPLSKIAQWIYLDRFFDGGCSSFILNKGGKTWVGRNNDYIAPGLWTQVNVLAKTGQIPVMLFGLEGELFSGTGYNRERLWLHYNWLPVWDAPGPQKNALQPFVFLREALATCSDIAGVERLLAGTVRDGGMNLFILDGKDNSQAVLECTCQGFRRRGVTGSFITGANHYCVTETPQGFDVDSTESRLRQGKMEALLSELPDASPSSLINILADPGVEQNHGLSGTVYANIACPALDEVWFACDSFPAASKSTWHRIPWPGPQADSEVM